MPTSDSDDLEALRYPIGRARPRPELTAAERGPLVDWLGGAAGRVHHLAFTCDEPASVPGAARLASGVYEVPPDGMTGTRLLLRAADH